MRATVLFLAAVLLPAPAAAQLAWARDYDDGVELFKKGTNDALAEQKLIQAREHPRAPDQSRKATWSSTYIKPFIPDYYLGLIAERRGEYAKAQRLLEGAIKQGLVTPGDRADYAAATASLQRARDGEARLASASRPPPIETKPSSVQPPQTASNPPSAPQPSGPLTLPSSSATATAVRPPPNPNPAATVTPPPITPATATPQPQAPAEPAWLASFRRAMDASRLSLSRGRYAEARSTLSAARGLAGTGATREAAASRDAADSLGREIDAAQSAAASRLVERARTAIRRKEIDTAVTQVAALETLSPGHVAIGELRNGIDRLRGELRGMADLARVERMGVKLFLSGNYKDSAAELERAVEAGVTSPRIYLFLASSHAAQALLAPEAERPALVEEARRTYALAKPGESGLAMDRRFISPSILKLLSGS